jgi:RNA polymerase sigma-70 factor (ECF subfamily)
VSERTAPDREWVLGLVDRFEGPLTIYATRLLRDVDRARDVVQDTFLRLWQSDRAQIEAHAAKWLYAVCRNRAHDVRRKEKRMTRLDDGLGAGAVAAEPPAASGSMAEAPRLQALVSALPARQQEAVRLKFQAGLSYREIAEVMDTTANNVGVLLHTAIKSIRGRLEAGAAAPELGGRSAALDTLSR